jgi:hypothetical protein
MAGRRKIEKITETDFTVLLQTLKDTPKGRLFLDEFGRRARTGETATLLESIHRMNKAISPFVGDGQIRAIAGELRRIAAATAEIVAALGPDEALRPKLAALHAEIAALGHAAGAVRPISTNLARRSLGKPRDEASGKAADKGDTNFLDQFDGIDGIVVPFR